jgi:hypothetical protein
VGVGRERRERGVFIAARCKRVQNRAVAIWRATRNEEQVTKWTENSFVCDGHSVSHQNWTEHDRFARIRAVQTPEELASMPERPQTPAT